MHRTVEENALRYTHVTVEMNRNARTATFIVKAPEGDQPADIASIETAGVDWVPIDPGA